MGGKHGVSERKSAAAGIFVGWGGRRTQKGGGSVEIPS